MSSGFGGKPKSEQTFSQGTFFFFRAGLDPTFPHEQALGDSGKAKLPLTGRNLEQNRTLGGRPSASTGWVERDGGGSCWVEGWEIQSHVEGG